MKIVAGGRTSDTTTGAIAKFGRLVAAALTLVALLDAAMLREALAQGSPFGGLRPGAAPVPTTGIVGWLFAKQAEFYRQFSGLIRASKADGTAAWSLMGVSFLYGIFHAAGARPRQGGDLFLPGRQRGDLGARRRAVAGVRADAGARGDCRGRRRGRRAACERRHHERRRELDRDLELHAHHPGGAASVVGEGPRLYRSRARTRPSNRGGRSRGDARPGEARPS